MAYLHCVYINVYIIGKKKNKIMSWVAQLCCIKGEEGFLEEGSIWCDGGCSGFLEVAI